MLLSLFILLKRAGNPIQYLFNKHLNLFSTYYLLMKFITCIGSWNHITYALSRNYHDKTLYGFSRATATYKKIYDNNKWVVLNPLVSWRARRRRVRRSARPLHGRGFTALPASVRPAAARRRRLHGGGRTGCSWRIFQIRYLPIGPVEKRVYQADT